MEPHRHYNRKTNSSAGLTVLVWIIILCLVIGAVVAIKTDRNKVETELNY